LIKDTFRIIGSGLLGLLGVVKYLPVAEESFFLCEGDIITVLGYLKYNASLGSLEFDDPMAIFLGGKTDFLNHLRYLRGINLKKSLFWILVISTLSLSRYIYTKSQIKTNQNLIDKINHKSPAAREKFPS
jgi:hypothetical protein